MQNRDFGIEFRNLRDKGKDDPRRSYLARRRNEVHPFQVPGGVVGVEAIKAALMDAAATNYTHVKISIIPKDHPDAFMEISQMMLQLAAQGFKPADIDVRLNGHTSSITMSLFAKDEQP